MSVETTDNMRALMDSIKKLTKQDILVGIPSTGNARESGDAMTNSEIGYLMEYGSPAQNIPERPTLIPGVARVKDKISERFRKAGVAAIDMKPAEMIRQMESAGEEAAQSVKAMINSNVPPELSKRTLAARAKRGVTRTNTLVDTGAFRNSITWVRRTR